MKRCVSLFLLLTILFSLTACGEKRTETVQDSNGNIIEQVFYQDGKVNQTDTYTYYESGAVHTKKSVVAPSSYSEGFTTNWTWAEDGKSYQETTYDSNGAISSDVFVELYDTTYENWRRRKTTTYYEGEWSTTSLEERLGDGTISVTDFTQDGKVTHVSVFDSQWNKLSKAYYNEAGVLADIEEYNIDGYAVKHTYYHSDGTVYSEYTDDSGKLLKYAFLANNGIFAEHSISNAAYTLDVGYRGGYHRRCGLLGLLRVLRKRHKRYHSGGSKVLLLYWHSGFCRKI